MHIGQHGARQHALALSQPHVFRELTSGASAVLALVLADKLTQRSFFISCDLRADYAVAGPSFILVTFVY